MSDKKPVVKMHKVLWLTTLACVCLISVLLVTQCVVFYRVLRLEGELKALRNTGNGLPDSTTLRLRQQRSINGENVTEPNEDLDRDQEAIYRNTSNSGACKLCSVVCPRTSNHRRKQVRS